MSFERWSASARTGPRLVAGHQLDRADQVDQLAEPGLVERRPGVVLRQHALERRVLPLDGDPSPHRPACRWSAASPSSGESPSGPPPAPRRRSRPCTRRGPRGRRAARLARASYRSWKASEMYFRKISPSTTCLYSAASMCPRILSAAAQSFSSNPSLAPFFFSFASPARRRAIGVSPRLVRTRPFCTIVQTKSTTPWMERRSDRPVLPVTPGGVETADPLL